MFFVSFTNYHVIAAFGHSCLLRVFVFIMFIYTSMLFL